MIGNDVGGLGSILCRRRDTAIMFRSVLRPSQPSNPVKPRAFSGDEVKNMYKNGFFN
jgi:hypothetical protein